VAPLPWRAIVRASCVGVLLTLCAVLLHLQATGLHPANLVQPGAAGPSAAAFREDFPELELPEGLGHDGQQFYAIARSLPSLADAAPLLDRPRYRLQRPVLPVLTRVLHPMGGGGTGLIAAMAAVGLLGVAAGAVATGALATRLGGSPVTAALFPILPGAVISLRIGVADALALALCAAALALSMSRHGRWAVAVAVVAVLTKEPSILVFVGFAAWRRDRASAALVVVPAAVAALWWAALHVLVGDNGVAQVRELVPPFVGFADAARLSWLHGEERFALVTLIVALVAGVVAALRCKGHPLRWVVAVQLPFVVVLNADVVGLLLNGPRATAPLLLFAALALLTPQPHRSPASLPATVSSGTAPAAAVHARH
jgi:hypothetical protein